MIDSRLLYLAMGKYGKDGVYDDRYASRLTLHTSEVGTIALEPSQKTKTGTARPFDFF